MLLPGDVRNCSTEFVFHQHLGAVTRVTDGHEQGCMAPVAVAAARFGLPKLADVVTLWTAVRADVGVQVTLVDPEAPGSCGDGRHLGRCAWQVLGR